MRGTVTRVEEGRWVVRWRTPDGRRPQKTLRTKRAAERFLRDRVDEIELGIGYINPRATFADFWPEWSAATEQSVDVRTWESYEGHWRNHLEALVGAERLADADARMVQRVINTLNQRKAPKTVRGVAGTLSSIIGMAAAQGRCRPLPRDKDRKPKLPQVKRRKLVIPTPLEVQSIANVIADPLRVMVLVCGTMGLRQGEAIALHPADIDLDRRKVYVHQHVHKTTGKRVEGTKEDAGSHVSMPGMVAVALEQHLAAYTDSEWVFNRGGRWYTASMVDKAWRRACKRAGVAGVRFHDLRHAAASLMISAGWNVKRVQMEMRHATAAFTLDSYGHLFHEDASHAQQQLDDALMSALATATGRVVDAAPEPVGPDAAL